MDQMGLVLLNKQTEDSLGFTVYMQELAYQYHLFFLVLIPRVCIATFEGLYSQDYLLLISGLLFMLIILVLQYFSKIKNFNTSFLLISLFLVMDGLIPFVSHRYILPVYPLILLFLLLRIKLVRSEYR